MVGMATRTFCKAWAWLFSGASATTTRVSNGARPANSHERIRFIMDLLQKKKPDNAGEITAVIMGSRRLFNKNIAQAKQERPIALRASVRESCRGKGLHDSLDVSRHFRPGCPRAGGCDIFAKIRLAGCRSLRQQLPR